MPGLVCLSSYLIAGELVGAKLAVGRERERARGRGREGREGERGRERESNRCVNAFLLECTVYHKTHTHNLVSSVDNFRFFLQVLCMIMAGYLLYMYTSSRKFSSVCIHLSYVRSTFSLIRCTHTHTFTCTHSPHSHTPAATT